MANKNISGDVNVEFTEAQSRQSLESGESVKTLFGKLRKWLTDLKPVAFSGSYNDLSNKPTIPSSVTITGAVNGTGALSGILVNRKCGLAQHNASGTSATPWYKVADVTLATYRDYTITFYVDSGLEGSANNVGILRVYTRIGASLQSPEHLKIRWLLVGANVDLNSFALSYDKSTGVCAIYANCAGAYSSYRFTVMSESDALNRQDTSIWTVYNAMTGIASLPTGDSIVTVYSTLADIQMPPNQSRMITDVTETSDTTSYLYKSSEHDAVYDELVGGSVAWNQLVQNGNFESTSGWTGRYSTVSVSNNICTVTPSSAGTLRGLIGSGTAETVSQNHKLLLSVYILSPITTNVGLSLNGNNQKTISVTANVWKKCECVWTDNVDTPKRLYALIIDNLTTSQIIQYKNVMAIDLTQMFGTTIADYVYNLEQSTAGSGIAWLKSYGFFTKDYYAYNAGALTSVNVSGKKVVGKNLLEITTESTTINGVTFTVDKATGTITANGTASANTFFAWKFTVEKGSYILSGCPTGGSINYYRIDIRYNVAGVVISNNAIDVGTGTTALNLTEDTDYYLNIRIQSGYITNNLVFKPMIRRADTDSTFEPYTSITYPIQSTDLRGLYKLDSNNKLYTDGDIYSADGQITRKYGIVDLGTLNWTYESNLHRFKTTSIQNSVGGEFHKASSLDSAGVYINNIISKYIRYNSRNNIPDKNYFIDYYPSNSSLNGMLYIYDTSYTNAATFKTAMSGVYLIYELSTPTTETAQPFTSPQMVYRNGTEEYLDTRDVPMPVGGNRKYVDIPEWMVNEYFDDVRAETSTVSDIIEKLRRIDVTNGSSSTVRTIYAPDANNGIRTTVRNNRTEVQVACGQASNANGKVVFTDSKIYGGIGNPTSAGVNHFMFNNNCGSDSIGKLSSGSPLTGSNFSLNYETINLKGSTININDNMSMAFETENDFTVNTINSPYMMINTDGISLLPKTLSYFSLLISRLPSGAGSELVVDSNGTVYQSSSSKDIKHDIQYIENTDTYHDALMQIKPATYVYNNDTSEATKLGMIAEDIADVMPIAALTGEGGKVENYDTRAIIAMLVMEVQRLNADIRRLRGEPCPPGHIAGI